MSLPKFPIVVFWFRRDLRLEDNVALYRALSGEFPVLPIFIFDPSILDQFEKGQNAQVEFILDEIESLRATLKAFGSTIKIYCDKPLVVFKKLCDSYNLRGVYANEDYELSSMRRDAEVSDFLATQNIPFHLFKDHVLFAKNEVVKEDGTPYTIFTPYSKRWLKILAQSEIEFFDSQKMLHNLYPFSDPYVPTLSDLGFQKRNVEIPSREIDKQIIVEYDKLRDYPSIRSTSRLGIHLRFGTISIRSLAREAMRLNSTFLNELIWRDFYHYITFHNPHICQGKSFKGQYDNIKWNNNEEEFRAWCEGKTGYPIVDAGMRELNATGFMHNRVRMVAASFLVKHLLIDWRWGEAYFANKLIDFDFAANNGGWQWAASCGCDAVPYFRIFNPELQASKFDREKRYIKKWLPEYDTLSYQSEPIVEHQYARARAIARYKSYLKQE